MTQRSAFHRAIVITLAAAAGVIAACSPRTIAESVALRSTVLARSAFAYGAHPRQILDVYRPRTAPDRAPVFVFLYGGRWSSGTRLDYRALAGEMTRRGWVVIVPDYRLSPEVKFPGWVEDAAGAVKWTFDNVSQFGGDTTRIYVAGHSAGGHTAALLALDERYLRAVGIRAQTVRGFVSIAGPVATTWTDPDVQAAMGPAAGWPATYPSTFIDGNERPLLLLHGQDDNTVSYLNSTGLAAKIRERGGCAKVRIYPSTGHIGIILAAMFPSFASASVLDDIVRFARSTELGTC